MSAIGRSWLALSALSIGVSACEGGGAALADGARLAPGDLGLLMPLGDAPELGLSAADTAGHGAVLPRAVFDRIPALTRIDEPDALYAALTTVAVRLDPCAREGGFDAPCRPQVRLVMQPVLTVEGSTTTRDATIHAFHDVSSEALEQLVRALASLREAHDGDGALGVPADPGGAAALIAAHVGARRLTRVTFMAVHASDEAWTFGSFAHDPATGALTAMTIPGTPDRAEQHLTSTGATRTLDATILPAPILEPELAPWLRAEYRADLQPARVDAARAALGRILDPGVHDPGTVDCASCHIASGALAFFARTPGAPAAGPYGDTRNQRMFGYFGETPSVSPRVVAEVMEGLSRLTPR